MAVSTERHTNVSGAATAVVLFSALGLVSFSPASGIAQDLSLTLQFSPDSAAQGTPVFALLTLRNTSGRALALPSLRLDGEWLSFQVQAEGGGRVYQDWVKILSTQNGPFQDTLMAGREWITSFLVQRHFFESDGDAERTGVSTLGPGTYRLSAKYAAWFPPADQNGVSSPTTRSDPVRLVIVPPTRESEASYSRLTSVMFAVRNAMRSDPVGAVVEQVGRLYQAEPADPWLPYLFAYAVPYAIGAGGRRLSASEEAALTAVVAGTFANQASVAAKAYVLENFPPVSSRASLIGNLPVASEQDRTLISFFAERYELGRRHR